jgi:Tol biopolymer transport system component
MLAGVLVITVVAATAAAIGRPPVEPARVAAARMPAAPGPGQPVTLGGNWIAFTRDRTGGAAFESGDEELWAIALDGTGAKQLTFDTCSDLTPAASPDGRWLAWVRKCGSTGWNNNNNVDIMFAPIVYDAVTGQPGLAPATNVTLALGTGADRWPQFSPDGLQLAFIRKTTGNFDIWRAGLTVSSTGVPSLVAPVRVVRLGGPQVEDCCVSWSPDGATLVWASNVNRYQQSFNLYQVPSTAVEIWDAVTNVDRSRDGTLDVTVVRQLTSGREYEGTPHHDADGTVLFRCNCPNPDVYRLDPVTGIRTRLTTYLGLDRTPEPYPGGLLYSRLDTRGSDEIFISPADGSAPVNLTNNPLSDVNPTWIPPQVVPG